MSALTQHNPYAECVDENEYPIGEDNTAQLAYIAHSDQYFILLDQMTDNRS